MEVASPLPLNCGNTSDTAQIKGAAAPPVQRLLFFFKVKFYWFLAEALDKYRRSSNLGLNLW